MTASTVLYIRYILFKTNFFIHTKEQFARIARGLEMDIKSKTCHLEKVNEKTCNKWVHKFIYLLCEDGHLKIFSYIHTLMFLYNFKQFSYFTLIKNIKSKTTTLVTGKHLEGFMRIATTEINAGTNRLLKQQQCQISH
jgi:hypothetical protein